MCHFMRGLKGGLAVRHPTHPPLKLENHRSIGFLRTTGPEPP